MVGEFVTRRIYSVVVIISFIFWFSFFELINSPAFSAEQQIAKDSSKDSSGRFVRILRKSKSLGFLSEDEELSFKDLQQNINRSAWVNVIPADEASVAGSSFPAKPFAKCKHTSKCSKEIVLDFGDISYIFPEVILHYLDDLQATELAWLPPVDFLLNIKYGSYVAQEERLFQVADKNIHRIGYLVRHNDEILETHGGSFNIEQDKYRDVPLCEKANISTEHQADKEVIETLVDIIAFVNSQSPEVFDSRKAIGGIGVVEYQFTNRLANNQQRNQKPFAVQSYFDAAVYTGGKDKICELPHCFKLSQIIKNTLEHGFESREQAQKVYQARLDINNKVSALLPSLNLGSVISLAQSSFFSVIPSLVGFAFPSNWFAFKESNKLLNAEMASYKTLLANQVTTVESLYLTIHNHLTNRDILIYYHELIATAIDYITKQEALLSRKVEGEELGYLKNILARVERKLLQVQSLIDDLLPTLASLFDFQRDWQKINIEALDFSMPHDIISIDPQNHLDLVYEKSSELETLNGLEDAAKLVRKSKYFDFLDPEGDGLGFNYTTKLKIAKSQQDQIQVRLQKMRASLKLALIHALNSYNTAVESYKNGKKQIDSLKQSAGALSAHLLSFEDLDIERIDRYFENAIKADIQKNTSMHMFKQSLASLDRLKWKGDIYEDIEKLRLVGDQPVW